MEGRYIKPLESLHALLLLVVVVGVSTIAVVHEVGVTLRYRTTGKLFNLIEFQFKNKAVTHTHTE